jgi:hypothetical protein
LVERKSPLSIAAGLVRLKTSSRIAELSQHEADGGELQEGEANETAEPELAKRVRMPRTSAAQLHQGAITTVLRHHGYDVTSTDTTDRGFGTPGIDFLSYENAARRARLERRPRPSDCRPGKAVCSRYLSGRWLAADERDRRVISSEGEMDMGTTTVNLRKLQEQLSRKLLDQIASVVCSLTYGEMIELSDGIGISRAQTGGSAITLKTFPALLHRWSKSRFAVEPDISATLRLSSDANRPLTDAAAPPAVDEEVQLREYPSSVTK